MDKSSQIALRARPLLRLSLHVLIIAAVGCGGGNGGQQPAPPPPPPADFGIATNSQSLVMTQGSSTTVQVSITALNGFTGSVSVTVAGLPTGLSATPGSNFNVAAGGIQTVTLTASNSATVGTFAVSFKGSSGSTQHTVSTTLQVQASQLTSFNVSINNSELSLVQGGSASTIVGLSLNSAGNSDFVVDFSISGLPSGVQATFGLNPFPFGQPATSLTLTSSSNATPVNYATVTVAAARTADGLMEVATFLLNVVPPVGSLPAIRTDFVRIDGTPAAAVYDGAHGVVFVSNPAWNRVDVILPQRSSITSSIPAPTPTAMALSPDGTKLLVGSNVNQLLSIDTTSLQVVNRTSFLPLPLGTNNPLPYYFNTQRIAPTSNGKVLLGLSNSLTNPPSFLLVEWDPTTGTFAPLNPPGISSSSVREVAGSANGSKILVVDYGTEVNLALYDAASDSFSASGKSPVGAELALAANPLGTQFAIIGVNGLAILDSQLNTIAEPPIGGGAVYGMKYSADGSRLYISYLLGNQLPIVETFDTTTLSLVGVAPAFSVCVFQPSGPCQPVMAEELAADNGGLVFSSFDHGLVFEDATNLKNLLALPASVIPPQVEIGPHEAPLNTTLATNLGNSVLDLTPDVWFGNIRGTGISSGVPISVTAPPSATAGLVNIKGVLPDGWMALTPQAFSYGAEILFAGASAGPSTGNVTLDLVGHGFVGSNPGATTVTIGGQPAKIVTAPHQEFGPSSDQFPILGLDTMQVSVPAGTPGPADITLTSTTGTSTLKGAFTYLPGVSDFASTDKFTNILYDSARNRVYLSAGNRIDVFDAGQHKFLSPITPPSISTSPLFQGLALTPDGTKLLATNFSDLSLEIINPDTPSIATEIPLIPGVTPVGIGGSDVAATSTNKAMIELSAQTPNGCSTGPVYEVDLNTHAVSPLAIAGLPCLQLNRVEMLSTRAGDKVFMAISQGGAYLWDASTDKWTSWQFVVNNNGTASADGYSFASDYTSLDAKLIEHNQAQIPGYFSNFFLELPQGAVAGEKMNASGSLLYQPLLHGVDVIDVNKGLWLRRAALTEQIQFVQNAMALDEAGERLFLITDAGLTLVQLDAPPLSVGYLNPAGGPSPGGTSVTIRGSGFQLGTTVTIGGVAAATSFVDTSTLTFATPALPIGGARITVSNPGGASYSLDAAFEAQ